MKPMSVVIFLLFSSLLMATPVVVKVEIKGAIGPAHALLLTQALQSARSHNANALLVELDTPGGLSSSMRDMIQALSNSPIPVITHVAPRGARAASAGTYLLYASHVAAMSPGTNLGAATPVSLMPPSAPDESNGTKTTAEKKALNDAVAYITSLAQMNERNVTWAVNAVESAHSLSAEDALRLGVIDLIADSTEELLKKLNGYTFKVSGKPVRLELAKSRVIFFEADWKIRFLAAVTDPNIAYLFLLIAVYGIFFEMMNPGAVFPGVVGAISAVIALFALNMLPFSYAGLLLILLGAAFMVAEVFVSGFGILGIGGVAAFIFGSLLLFDAQTLGSGISLPLVIAFGAISLGFFLLVARLYLRSRSAKVVAGVEGMIGAEAEVVTVDQGGYHVLCHGEMWHALSDSALAVGRKVRVVGLDGLVLKVEPKEE